VRAGAALSRAAGLSARQEAAREPEFVDAGGGVRVRVLRAHDCRDFTRPCHAVRAVPAPPPLPYKVDTSRPSLRTNRTRLVPSGALHAEGWPPGGAARRTPPPTTPSRTNWTRLVPPSRTNWTRGPGPAEPAGPARRAASRTAGGAGLPVPGPESRVRYWVRADTARE